MSARANGAWRGGVERVHGSGIVWAPFAEGIPPVNGAFGLAGGTLGGSQNINGVVTGAHPMCRFSVNAKPGAAC